MNIAFRVDASAELGTGHLMRCLTLARELKARGARARFFCRPLPQPLEAKLQQEGWTYRLLDDPDETAQLTNLLREEPPDWLVVDHYGWSRPQEQALRGAASRILVIDDLADRTHDCDVLLDQNYFEHPEARYAGLVPDGCRLLLGPKYALLRPEFARQRQQVQERVFIRETFHLLVSFGGSDPDGGTLKVLDALADIDLTHIRTQVIAGGANPALAEIRQRCERLQNVTCHTHVDDMAGRMAQADLFIGAGGTTTWERMALGLPGIIISIADNQVELSRAVADAGAHIYLGESDRVTPHRIAEALQLALSQPGLRKDMSEKAMALVDGLGCLRVADALLPVEIVLRPATDVDSRNLYEWRNHPDTRRYSFDSEPIPWETHAAWFANSLKNPNRILLVGEENAQPVGVLRYDVHDDGTRCTVSIYKVPGVTRPGIGTRLLDAGSAWLRRHHPQLEVIEAEIVPENVASVKAFEKAGYVFRHHIYEKQLKEIPVV